MLYSGAVEGLAALVRGLAMRKLNEWLKQRSETAEGVAGFVPAMLGAVLGEPRATPLEHDPLTHRVKKRSNAGVGAFCFCLAVLVAIVDYATVPRISFALFYLLIVAFAAWAAGRRMGIFLAAVSAVALFVAEVRHESPVWPRVWNLGAQFGISVFAVMLVAAIHDLTENLEWRVKDRTRALEREISDRRQTENQLVKTMQQFRQLAENIADAFWMRDAQEARMVYISPAYEGIWGRGCKELYQSPQLWLEAVHPEDREQVARAIDQLQFAGEYNLEYRIVRPDGTLRWIRDRAFPIRDGAGKVIRIVGVAEDITDRRRLEREILEISDREQARLGQDLHDGLCQQLVSMAFDNSSLERRLAARQLPEAEAAQHMASMLDDIITEARALARGLFPVQLETDGLSVALGQLAATVSSRAKVNCTVECPQPVLVPDNAVATHLYRIAQEAVNNAVKHSKAKSIVIRLTSTGERVELRITDDGVGIPVPLNSSGMGMHIMNYRARTIGGTLSIERRRIAGTVVSCVAQQQAI